MLKNAKQIVLERYPEARLSSYQLIGDHRRYYIAQNNNREFSILGKSSRNINIVWSHAARIVIKDNSCK